jgi:hypothetical protein
MEIVILLVIIGVGIFLLIEGKMPIVPSNTVQKIAQAIARAEGFYVQGSIPQRANNPGDLELGDLGNGTISGKTVFPSASQGWQRLYVQVQGMLDGSSKIYGPDWTIQDVASTYTGNDNASSWAQNVADYLGVGTDTQLGQIS